VGCCLLKHSLCTESKMTSTQDVKADSVSQLSKEAIPEVGFTPGPQMLNIRKVIPNSLTVLATVVGSGGIFFGMNGRYEDAVKCVLLAGVLGTIRDLTHHA
jgi:hypothetical protein